MQIKNEKQAQDRLVKNYYVHSRLENFLKFAPKGKADSVLNQQKVLSSLQRQIKRSQKLETEFLTKLQVLSSSIPELKTLKKINGMSLSKLQDLLGITPIHLADQTNFEKLFEKVVEDLQLGSDKEITVNQIQQSFSQELENIFENLSKEQLDPEMQNIIAAFMGQPNIFSSFSRSVSNVNQIFNKAETSPYEIFDKKNYARIVGEFSAFIDTMAILQGKDEVSRVTAEVLSKIPQENGGKIQVHSGKENKADFSIGLKDSINIGFSVKQYRPEAEKISLHQGGALFDSLENGFLNSANQQLTIDKILKVNKIGSSFNDYLRYYLANYLAFSKSGYVKKGTTDRVEKIGSLKDNSEFAIIQNYIDLLTSYWIGNQVLQNIKTSQLENSEVGFFISNGKIVPVSEVLLEVKNSILKNNNSLIMSSFSKVPTYGPTILYQKKLRSIQSKEYQGRIFYPDPIVSIGADMGNKILTQTVFSIKIKMTNKLKQMMMR